MIRASVFFAVLFVFCVHVFAQATEPLQTAPNFSAYTVAGNRMEVDFSQYKGKPVVLFFWNSNKKDGARDFDVVTTFAKMRHDVIVITVYYAGGRDDTVLRTLLKKHFPEKRTENLIILKDTNDGEVYSRIYQANLLPSETFLINSRGKVTMRKIGSLDWNSPRVALLIAELKATK